MSYGWSAGDIAICIKLCVEIYNFWKSAEQDVRDVLEKFEYTRCQLVALEDLLRETGWPPYPGASKLKADLEKHYEFFRKMPALTNQSSAQVSPVMAKSREKAKLATRMSELNKIKIELGEHDRKLLNFKVNIILKISLEKVKSNQDQALAERLTPLDRQFRSPTRRDDAKSNFSQPLSVLSKAQQSLLIAARINQDNLKAHPYDVSGSSSGSLAPLSRIEKALQTYVQEVVSAAESGKLYAKSVSLDEKEDQLRTIGDALDRVREVANNGTPESRKSMALLTIPTSPQSFGDSVNDSLASDVREFWHYTPPSSIIPPGDPEASDAYVLASPSNRPRSTFRLDVQKSLSERLDPTASTSQRDSLMALPSAYPAVSRALPNSSEVELETNPETFRNAWTSENLEDASLAPIFLQLDGSAFISGHRLMGGRYLRRQLSFATSEASACIRAGPEPHWMTPSRLFADDPDDPRVFQHPFVQGLASFPRIHHPSIDIVDPVCPQAPYSIHFTRPQFANIESIENSNDRCCNFKYHFESSEDRTIVREAIFGKAWLADAGAAEVQLDDTTLCDLECISLWQKGDTDISDAATSISLTVPRYSKINRSTPEKIEEFSILSNPNFEKNLIKARKPGAKLVLCVRLLGGPNMMNATAPAPEGSITTANTKRSSLTRFTSRGRSSAAQPKPSRISIWFSEDEDGGALAQSKDTFLNVLQSTLDEPTPSA